MKFNIEITETLQKTIEIEAETEQEALDKVEQHYWGGDIYLNSEDYTDTQFKRI